MEDLLYLIFFLQCLEATEGEDRHCHHISGTSGTKILWVFFLLLEKQKLENNCNFFFKKKEYIDI